MKEVELKSVIKACQIEELSAEEQHLVNLAIEATQRMLKRWRLLPVVRMASCNTSR